MRSLKFNLIRAKNILCFGPDGIEIHFSNYGNIVQVCGVNLDAPGTEESPASNGAGKSSIQELLSIGLFGRTVKNPTKNKSAKIINILAQKGEIEIQWDDFRVIRSYKKSKSGTVTSSLDLWQSKDHSWNDDTKISFGTSEETQKFIEEKIGLSHHAFCNVIIFDDSNTYSFLEADAATKRNIVENLLDLEQYREYQNNCKEIQKETKKKISDIGLEYSHLKDSFDSCLKRLDSINQQDTSWKNNKQKEIKSLIELLKNKQNELKNLDQKPEADEWQKAQEKICELEEEITDLESKKQTVEQAIKNVEKKLEKIKEDRDKTKEQIQNHSMTIKSINLDLEKANKLINDLENLKEGTKCPTCMGVINKDNFNHVIDHGKSTIEQCQEKISKKEMLVNQNRQIFSEKSSQINQSEEKIGQAKDRVVSIENKIKSHKLELAKLKKISKPEEAVTGKVLEIEVESLKKQIKQKKEELEADSPYKEILEECHKEKKEKQNQYEEKEKKLKELEELIPYYEFWNEAFGDNGIRKTIIDNIVPALNDRVAYWMEILIDGLIEVTFDNKLEETITRNGNQAFYHNMSKGEIRRVNLAVSQSFAYIMMLNSGHCPSLIFLDEITGGGIDKAGVPYVYNMIIELAKERQVFVTTHNEVLTNLLSGCECLTLKKQNDVTKIV